METNYCNVRTRWKKKNIASGVIGTLMSNYGLNQFLKT